MNRILYSTERAFRHDPGLPRRDWFKHLAYAPGFYTGYGVKTLPGIREAIEQKQWDEAKSFIPIVSAAIEKLAAEVDRARGLLERAGKTLPPPSFGPLPCTPVSATYARGEAPPAGGRSRRTRAGGWTAARASFSLALS